MVNLVRICFHVVARTFSTCAKNRIFTDILKYADITSIAKNGDAIGLLEPFLISQ